jgi:hypothetical protein
MNDRDLMIAAADVLEEQADAFQNISGINVSWYQKPLSRLGSQYSETDIAGLVTTYRSMRQTVAILKARACQIAALRR